MLQQKQELNEKLAKLNYQTATIETDFTDPQYFDVSRMKAQTDNEETKKWRCVYVTYFDATKSIKEGRRLPKEKCVDSPNIHLIAYAVELLKLRHVVERCRKHPRDYFGLGRLKVQMVDEQGYHMNNDVGISKRKLFNAIAEKLPEAKIKYDFILAEQKEKARVMEEEFKKTQPQLKAQGAPEAAGESKKNKKKNKK